jgi:hypothetical protein
LFASHPILILSICLVIQRFAFGARRNRYLLED